MKHLWIYQLDLHKYLASAEISVKQKRQTRMDGEWGGGRIDSGLKFAKESLVVTYFSSEYSYTTFIFSQPYFNINTI